jgi:putative ABC transport system ATP-binding protein
MKPKPTLSGSTYSTTYHGPQLTFLATLLKSAALELGVELDLVGAKKAWKTELFRAGSTWHEQFQVLPRVVHKLNLVAYPVEHSLEQVRNIVSKEEPLITLTASTEQGSQWLMLGGYESGSFRVFDSHSDGEWRLVPEQQLSELMGLEAEVSWDWWHLEPALPLQSAIGVHKGVDGHDSHSSQPHRRLWTWMIREKRDLLVVVCYAFAVGLLSLVLPIASQALVNTVAFGTVLQPLFVLVLIVFVGFGVAGLLKAMKVYVVELLQRRLFAHVAMDFAHRIPRIEQHAFDQKWGPELLNRFFDVITVQKSASSLLLDGVSLVLQTGVGLVVLALYHPLFLLFALALVIGIGAIVGMLGRGGTTTSIKESKAKYSVAAWLEEMARQPDVFRSAQASAFATERTDELVRTYLGYRTKHFGVVLRQTIGFFAMHALASAVLLGAGGFLVISQQLTLGQLVAAELIVASVLTGLVKFTKHFEIFYDLLAAIDKLAHLVDLPLRPISEHEQQPESDQHHLSFERLSLQADGKVLFSNATQHVQQGEIIALLGGHGSGKSTLLDTLAGIRHPHSGYIRINGVDIKEWNFPDLRNSIAVVRDQQVFAGTIHENLTLGDPNLGTRALEDVLQRVGLWDIVKHLPQGIHTQLTPKGLPLSQGQIRQLLIARAWLSQPKLMLLDGILDELTPDVRNQICQQLCSNVANQIVIIATQLPEVAQYCQRRWVLNNQQFALVSNP